MWDVFCVPGWGGMSGRPHVSLLLLLAGLGWVGLEDETAAAKHTRTEAAAVGDANWAHGCIVRRANSRQGDGASEAMRGRRRKVAVLPERSKTIPYLLVWARLSSRWQPCWLAGDGRSYHLSMFPFIQSFHSWGSSALAL